LSELLKTAEEVLKISSSFGVGCVLFCGQTAAFWVADQFAWQARAYII